MSTRSRDEATRDDRNIWVVSLTSFLTDVSSEMVLHLVPLYLSGVLGVGVHVIGLVEGIAKSLTSLLRLAAGHLADRWRARKWLAVAGYGLSALAKPFFAVASTWQSVAAVRWVERTGKGIRTAPRDALLADSADPKDRGFVFGFHRAADTLGAVVGLGIAIAFFAWFSGEGFSGDGSADGRLTAESFSRLVWWSVLPAFLAVGVLAVGARDVPFDVPVKKHRLGLKGLGRPFFVFLAIVALFDLGDSSDAFLVLRAAEQGMGVADILALLLTFNIVFAALSTPAGRLSDRVDRRLVLVAGWLLYGAVYWGFAKVQSTDSLWPLFAFYGAYHGLTHGTAKALVADLVPEHLRGTGFGTYHATLGVLDLPASLIAGLLWQYVDPAAPFYFSAATAGLAALALFSWRPHKSR